jgi:hypothetical protein
VATNTTTDLLAEIDQPNSDSYDLLGEIDEGGDGATAWMPAAGEGVQGTIVAMGTRPSDYPAADGSIIQCPVITLQTAAGDKVRITAYQSVLRGAIQEANPQVGDLFAAKYFGKVTNKKGTGSYHSYKVACRPVARTAGSAVKAPF